MATFRKGQKVRVIGHVLEPGNMDFRGREGTVHGYERGLIHRNLLVRVELDHKSVYCFAECELAPLTDPKADAFLESVKSWKPEPVAPPLPVKERA